ncbi:MAG: PAS domain S-box protein [Chloroflexi bacterium]|nr:PAS domain S-box protein [Chloroflexota bacterium]
MLESRQAVRRRASAKPDILESLADAPDGIYAVDMSQRIVLWNRGAESLLGYPADEVLGKRCYQVLGGLTEDEERVCLPNCASVLWARQGSTAPFQRVLARTKEGKSRWISISHVLLPASRRELGVLVHIFHDATEGIEAKHLLQRLTGILAKASEAMIPPWPAPLEVPARLANLSLRELQVLRLLARGLGTKTIAQDLVVSPTTVRNHIQRILVKLGVHNRLEAVAAASRSGLL